jgi:uncharacterized protein (TIGR03435 family)
MARRIRWIGSLLFAIGAARCPAQTAASAELRFDVATVRLNRQAACRGRWDLTAARGVVTAVNAPLLRIISRAYNLTDDRVSGPAWIESQCYDIRAKTSAGVPDRDLMPMLRTLLRERLHLVAQRESGERPIFALVADKGGTKLHPYGDKVERPSYPGATLFMVRHLPDLCERIGKVTGRPVVDKTGLDGDYQIELTYLPFGSTNPDASDPAPDIIAAVRDQLGLRLEAQRGVVDILKIDNIDRVPTEN